MALPTPIGSDIYNPIKLTYIVPSIVGYMDNFSGASNGFHFLPEMKSINFCYRFKDKIKRPITSKLQAFLLWCTMRDSNSRPLDS